jgi:hypothetical protein
LAKVLAKCGSVSVVYGTLSYGILARAGLVLDSSQSGQPLVEMTESIQVHLPFDAPVDVTEARN